MSHAEDDPNLQFDPAEHFEGFEELLAESEAGYRANTYAYRDFDISKGSLPGQWHVLKDRTLIRTVENRGASALTRGYHRRFLTHRPGRTN